LHTMFVGNFGNRAEPRTNALRCMFLHLRFCMLTARTIENEYLGNPFEVRRTRFIGSRQWHEGDAGRSFFHEIYSKFVRRSRF
jgi:hypothetical protein